MGNREGKKKLYTQACSVQRMDLTVCHPKTVTNNEGTPREDWRGAGMKMQEKLTIKSLACGNGRPVEPWRCRSALAPSWIIDIGRKGMNQLIEFLFGIWVIFKYRFRSRTDRLKVVISKREGGGCV